MYEVLLNIPTRDLCTMLTTSKAVYLDVKGILHSRLETHLRENGDHKLLVLPHLPSVLFLNVSLSEPFPLSWSQANVQFEAFLPNDQSTVPYHLSAYTHTSPESPAFTAPLYSYFTLTTPDPLLPAPTWPGRLRIPFPFRATYSFTLSPDDPWAQLALQGNLVKLSDLKPSVLRSILPCFRRHDFVRLKKFKLDELARSEEAEMIWVNERREVGVWTRVLERCVVGFGEEIETGGLGALGRERILRGGVPMYTRQREGSVRYTLGFEFLAMKTGYGSLV